ncbi:MAG: hypothetical protein A2293_02120 [Elusimicrobia bacterium RIFOXYB2_FULL_49_7]|nr:MAG: hypothetical protein A2293_02120 [Elusimicrobia bacterium RIFOXYB2_FULL_49_7]
MILLLLLFSFVSYAQSPKDFSLEEEQISTDAQNEQKIEAWQAEIYPDISLPSVYTRYGENLGYVFPVDSGAIVLKEGLAWFRSGNMEKAGLFFKKSFSQKGRLVNYAKYWELYAVLKAGRFQEALLLYQELCTLKEEPDLSVVAGMDLLEAGLPYTDTVYFSFLGKLLNKRRDSDLLFLAGQKNREAGRFQTALNYYIDILRKDPSSPFADSALRLCDTLLKNKQAVLNGEKAYILAKNRLDKRQTTEVLVLCETFLKKEPAFRSRFLMLLAKGNYQKGNYQYVLRYLKQLEKEKGPSSFSTLFIARSLSKLKKTSAARAKYLEYLALYPKSRMCENILWDIGRTHEEKKEYPYAVFYFKRIVKQYPSGNMADKAFFRMGYCHYKNNKKDSALAVWQKESAFANGSEEVSAAYYWSAKVHFEINERDSVPFWLIRCVENNPLSYYAFRALSRLRELKEDSLADRLSPAPETSIRPFFLSLKNYRKSFPDKFPEIVIKAYERGLLLLDCGLSDFALRELKPVERFLERDYLFQYHLIKTYESRGFFREAHRLSRNLITKLPSSDYRFLPGPVIQTFYPRYFGEVVELECAKYGMDPLYIHSLIRQESAYHPRAFSFAGAIGLMQLMPATAKTEACDMSVLFSKDSLFHPFYNIRLGTHHVDKLRKQFQGHWELVFAAYNAGANAALRWKKEQSTVDEDGFIEEIGYTETRGYVKKCLQNYWIYRFIWSH